jgi:hypothetical protein
MIISEILIVVIWFLIILWGTLILFTYVKNSGTAIRVACHHNMTHRLDEDGGQFQIHSVHIKRIPFYCNIAHELKGAGMKTKHIWVGYMIKFIIHATWVSKSFHLKTTLTVVKTASQVEKAKCVLCIHKSRSAATMQRRFCMEFGTKTLINKWYKWFDPTGCICKGKRSGRWSVTEAQMHEVQAAFICNPCKLTRYAAWQ